MAGRHGNKQKTQQNLQVVRVDTELDLVFVRGAVPGVDDAHVLMRDAKKKMTHDSKVAASEGRMESLLPKGVDDLPFPAGTKEMAGTMPVILMNPTLTRSPFVPRE